MRRFFAASVVLILPSAAQEAVSLLPADQIVPIHTHSETDYGLWSVGADFKVSFHDGFEFVPYLGSDYPANLLLRWRTQSVLLGEREYATRAAVGRRVRGDRYEYDLGEVVEAYDIRAEGVEQTFRIDTPPAGGGELVITGLVDTPLTAEVRDLAHAPIGFAGPAGEAIVEYGAATAIDARGETFPMASSWDGQHLRLHLGSDQVRNATFPLLVDPTLLSSTSNAAIGRTSVATPPGAGWRYVAFTRIASASDHDVFVLAYDAGWTNRTYVVNDATSTYSTNNITCADYAIPSLAGQSPALLVYEMRYPSKTELYVVGLGFGSSFRVTAAVGDHLLNPALSAANEITDAAILVFDHRSASGFWTVRGIALYDDPFWGPLHDVQVIGNVASPSRSLKPRVAAEGGGTWTVYWLENDSSESRIMTRKVFEMGLIQPSYHAGSGPSALLRSATHTFREPRLAEGGRFLTYVRTPRSIGTSSVMAASEVNGSYDNARTMHAGRSYTNGGVAADPRTRSHAVASYVVRDGTNWEVRFERLGADARVTSTMFSFATNQPFAPEVAFAELGAASLQHGEYVGAFATNASFNPIYGQEMPYPIEPFQPTLVLGTPDCGGTDELSGFVSPSLAGHAGYRVELHESAQFAVLLIGTQTTPVPLDVVGMTGCYLNVDAIVSVVATRHPSDQIADLPLSSSPSMVGVDLFMQWVWDSPGANPLGIVSSSAVRVRVR